jgi:glycolate oxidase iron-sulfur subunit
VAAECRIAIRMQTHFTLGQLADPNIKEADKILRSCVHCGFCTATCPTYVLLGDELDSPRGRIYLIKDTLEKGRAATKEFVTHIDRCLSCLSCMTTCPSGVHYMHLVDHARVHIENTYERPWLDRTLRNLLARVMPYPKRFRFMLLLGALGKPFAGLFSLIGLKQVGAMLRLTPWLPEKLSHYPEGAVLKAEGRKKGRVALMSGCVDQVVAPSIRDAAIRLLNRHGIEVVLPKGEACCGSLSHHMGREHEALDFVRNNVDAWTREIEGEGLDAILITASGCGTTVKDYGYMLRLDPAYAEKAARVASLARDISEYMAVLGLDLGLNPPAENRGIKVAYHSACSMQHGQKITAEPKALLAAAGFAVKDVPEGHICCGSAGTYNMLQPEISSRLLARKVANIESLQPQLIATGNIGCMRQIGSATGIPVVHTVELLDWATGGPAPKGLESKF